MADQADPVGALARITPPLRAGRGGRRWLHTVRSRYRYDRYIYASRSRFIPGSLLPLFESVTWPTLAPEIARQVAISQMRIDVGARMRGMWR
jgi:hypothetical protein